MLNLPMTLSSSFPVSVLLVNSWWSVLPLLLWAVDKNELRAASPSRRSFLVWLQCDRFPRGVWVARRILTWCRYTSGFCLAFLIWHERPTALLLFVSLQSFFLKEESKCKRRALPLPSPTCAGDGNFKRKADTFVVLAAGAGSEVALEPWIRSWAW